MWLGLVCRLASDRKSIESVTGPTFFDALLIVVRVEDMVSLKAFTSIMKPELLNSSIPHLPDRCAKSNNETYEPCWFRCRAKHEDRSALCSRCRLGLLRSFRNLGTFCLSVYLWISNRNSLLESTSLRLNNSITSLPTCCKVYDLIGHWSEYKGALSEMKSFWSMQPSSQL